MATEKNITMKQFNGMDYDTLYPKTIASQIPDVYSKTEVLTTETLSKYGLTADKLPNDVFQQIKTLIDNAQASADGKARIQTGSYVGTGTYGASNPCSLTFDFAPSMVWIYTSKSSKTVNDVTVLHYPFFNENCLIPTANLTTSWVQGGSFGSNNYSDTYGLSSYGKKSEDGKTIYWYNEKTGSQGIQGYTFNSSNEIYYYLAIE